MVKFIALLELKNEADGGRKTPIENGFRTDLLYGEGESRFTAFEIDGSPVYPGSSKEITCYLLLHSDQEVQHVIDKGELDVVEGACVIGTVLIKDVINRADIVWKEQ